MEAGAPHKSEREGEPGPLGLGGGDMPADAVADRVNAVIEAAEQAAAAIREDAEAEVRTYLRGSRQAAERLVDERTRMIVELTDSLIARASSVQQEFESLTRAIEEGQDQLRTLLPRPGAIAGTESPSGGVESAAEPIAPPVPAMEPTVSTSSAGERVASPAEPSAPAGPAAGATGGWGGPADVKEAPEDPAVLRARQEGRARLAAMQMALAGSGRGEIADRLRAEYAIADPTSILDELSRSVGDLGT
jgi:hypothetical protein